MGPQQSIDHVGTFLKVIFRPAARSRMLSKKVIRLSIRQREVALKKWSSMQLPSARRSRRGERLPGC